MKTKVLFVNQPLSQCGVYEFGKLTHKILNSFNGTKKYSFEYVEPKDSIELYNHKNDCVAAIFNYHPMTMSWLNEHVIRDLNLPSALMMHDTRTVFGSSVVLHPDPSYITMGIDYKVGRPILKPLEIKPAVLQNTIGSFGFGTSYKGFNEVIHKVNQEFDEATIRFHIPLNTIIDSAGSHAFSTRKKLEKIPIKPGIKLEFSHDYLTDEELLKWLGQNTVNVFMYRNSERTRDVCSSVIDWAIAARRPIAVSNDIMFHHLHTVEPSVCLCNNTLKTIIANGTTPLEPLYEEWTWENLYLDYERMLDENIRASR